MSEWFKETVLKTVGLKSSVGSNPTSSAIVGDTVRFLSVWNIFFASVYFAADLLCSIAYDGVNIII